ncbi:hypothetical protein BKA81DRAFT_165335 [Phyllosticta paracitricarpa]
MVLAGAGNQPRQLPPLPCSATRTGLAQRHRRSPSLHESRDLHVHVGQVPDIPKHHRHHQTSIDACLCKTGGPSRPFPIPQTSKNRARATHHVCDV